MYTFLFAFCTLLIVLQSNSILCILLYKYPCRLFHHKYSERFSPGWVQMFFSSTSLVWNNAKHPPSVRHWGKQGLFIYLFIFFTFGMKICLSELLMCRRFNVRSRLLCAHCRSKIMNMYTHVASLDLQKHCFPWRAGLSPQKCLLIYPVYQVMHKNICTYCWIKSGVF